MLILYICINPFCVICLFLYPLKTTEKKRFSNIFRGCRKRPVAWNGLIVFFDNCSSIVLWKCSKTCCCFFHFPFNLSLQSSLVILNSSVLSFRAKFNYIFLYYLIVAKILISLQKEKILWFLRFEVIENLEYERNNLFNKQIYSLYSCIHTKICLKDS